MGVDILGVDIVGIDILGDDILGRLHVVLSIVEGASGRGFEIWARFAFHVIHVHAVCGHSRTVKATV